MGALGRDVGLGVLELGRVVGASVGLEFVGLLVGFWVEGAPESGNSLLSSSSSLSSFVPDWEISSELEDSELWSGLPARRCRERV